MKQKIFIHFTGFILLVIFATLAVFTTMFISYKSYSNEIKNAAPQIRVGMQLAEVEKLLGKADNTKWIEGKRYMSWSASDRYSGFLEKFDLVDYGDYPHLNIVVDLDENIVESF